MRLHRIRVCFALVVAAACGACSSSSNGGPTTQGDDGGTTGWDASPGIDGGSRDAGRDAASEAAPGEAGSPDGGASAEATGNILGFSTVPPMGPTEGNPYGVAIVPADFPTGGMLQPGDVLVANFNGVSNAQGTGTTIVRVASTGARSTFFTSTLTGLSGALSVLKGGLVVVGNVPNTSTDGGEAVGNGALQVLDGNGKLVQTLADATLLEDPWGMAVNDLGATAQLFVSNVISGGITRLDVAVAATGLTVNKKTQIASGYATRTDPGAFVVGPGEMVYDAAADLLYVASSGEKVNGVEAGTIFTIATAGTRTTDAHMGTPIFADAMHLHGPIGLVQLPNGDLLTANSDAVNADPMQPSTLVELTTKGQFVGQMSVDPNNGGAFGVATGSIGGQAALAAIDDNQSTLTVWETAQPYPPTSVLSTVPPGGPAEGNPYGVAIVPADFPTTGMLQPGDVLVSNFNDADNVQGTGTTVVRISAGAHSTFFTSSQVGLSAVLSVLKAGLVVVGNVPNVSTDGGAAVGPGELQVLDGNGKVLGTLADPTLLEDPWAMTVNDMGTTAQLFVSNVISGTVTRLDVTVAATGLTVNKKTQIASGYATRTDPGAFVVGPGGLVYDAASDTLYVAAADEMVSGTEAGTIFAVATAGTRTTDAGKGKAIYADATRLHGPIGLVMAPNGHLITANSDAVNADPMQPSTLVELTTEGQYVNQVSVDPNNGAAFGVTVGSLGGQQVLLYENDNQATLTIRQIP